MPPSEDGRSTVSCKYHSSGFCVRGGSCPFRHEGVDQPANVHIPAAQREKYERAIRGLSVDSAQASASGSPAASGAGTPLMSNGRTPPRTPPPDRSPATSPPPGDVRHVVYQDDRRSEAARIEVLRYFTSNLLSPRRHDPGGGQEQACVAEFSRYVMQLTPPTAPTYDEHVHWVNHFNTLWGPTGRGVSKWLNHGILGKYLEEHLSFRWKPAAVPSPQPSEFAPVPQAFGGGQPTRWAVQHPVALAPAQQVVQTGGYSESSPVPQQFHIPLAAAGGRGAGRAILFAAPASQTPVAVPIAAVVQAAPVGSQQRHPQRWQQQPQQSAATAPPAHISAQQLQHAGPW